MLNNKIQWVGSRLTYTLPSWFTSFDLTAGVVCTDVHHRNSLYLKRHVLHLQHIFNPLCNSKFYYSIISISFIFIQIIFSNLWCHFNLRSLKKKEFQQPAYRSMVSQKSIRFICSLAFHKPTTLISLRSFISSSVLVLKILCFILRENFR